MLRAFLAAGVEDDGVPLLEQEPGGHLSESVGRAMRNLTFGSEVRKASDKPSDNGPS